MKPIVLTVALLALPLTASAVQETFTDAGPLDCTAIKTCTQITSDGVFALRFKPAYPWSAPSAQGFEVRQPSVELRNANGGLLDLGSMSVSLSGSNSYNGSNFIGAVRLEVQEASGTWSTASQWSSWVNSPTGIYVIFNGHNAQRTAGAQRPGHSPHRGQWHHGFSAGHDEPHGPLSAQRCACSGRPGRWDNNNGFLRFA